MIFLMDDIQLRLAQEGRIDLVVRVRPHAARSRWVGVLQDGSVKIDIAAPAEDGRGNAALLKFLAEVCAVPLSQVRLLSGKTSRIKLVRIHASQDA